ncbi:hypothetical protein HDV04_005744 [Boothiomyces sp. JEL0838]|nr:hypothetical protein HDV04_005744 [Boothiomyces sp. JEL0838]
MDVCNFLSGVALGMTVSDIGLQPVIAGKKIPVLMFLTAVTAFIYILGFEIQARVPLDPSSPEYAAVGVLMSIADAVTSIPYTYAMISRLIAILPIGTKKNYLYMVMIVPLVYPVVDIYAILLLLGYPLNPVTSAKLFAVGGFAFGFTFFVIDIAVTLWLLKYNSSDHKLIYYFPFFAGLFYMGTTIAAAFDTNIDSSPVYLAYCIDILAYQQVSRSLTRAVVAPKKGSSKDSQKKNDSGSTSTKNADSSSSIKSPVVGKMNSKRDILIGKSVMQNDV